MSEPRLTREENVFFLSLGSDQNRLDQLFLDEVGQALNEVEAHEGPAALVTTGEGKFYSNGFHLDWMGGLERDDARRFLADTQRLWARLLVFPVATVAAINGHSFGAGAVMCLAHDYRVMRADRGFFCFPEIDLRLRFRPGMMALVQCKLTPAVCREALLSGMRYGAGDAVQLTLVDEAVPLEKLREAALARVAPLASKDREAMRQLKLSMYREPYEKLMNAGAARS